MESRARIVRLLFLAIETLTLSMKYRVVALLLKTKKSTSVIINESSLVFSTMEVKLAGLFKTNAFDAPQMVWVRMSGVCTFTGIRCVN